MPFAQRWLPSAAPRRQRARTRWMRQRRRPETRDPVSESDECYGARTIEASEDIIAQSLGLTPLSTPLPLSPGRIHVHHSTRLRAGLDGRRDPAPARATPRQEVFRCRDGSTIAYAQLMQYSEFLFRNFPKPHQEYFTWWTEDFDPREECGTKNSVGQGIGWGRG